jgi:hypothetical protein
MMAEKKPLCIYAGKKELLHDGDTLPGITAPGDTLITPGGADLFMGGMSEGHLMMIPGFRDFLFAAHLKGATITGYGGVTPFYGIDDSSAPPFLDDNTIAAYVQINNASTDTAIVTITFPNPIPCVTGNAFAGFGWGFVLQNAAYPQTVVVDVDCTGDGIYDQTWTVNGISEHSGRTGYQSVVNPYTIKTVRFTFSDWSTTGWGALNRLCGWNLDAQWLSAYARIVGPVFYSGLTLASGNLTVSSGNVSATNLSGTNTGDQTLSDATISTTDITTNDVSTTKHGFTPKAPNDTAKFLRGDATWAAPSVGTHKSTHVSGASDEIDGDKIDIDFAPVNFTPTLVTNIADSVAQLSAFLKGIDVGLPPAPGTPMPDFQWVDTTHISLPPGRFYQMGHRIRRQYQSPSGLFWTNAAYASIAINGTYAAGTTSGILGGKVNSSWYSVWFMGLNGSGVPVLLLLPYVRVQNITWSGGNSNIELGNHATAASVVNTFVTAADQFNNYRLVKITRDANDGTTWTIGTTYNGTNDQLRVASNITSLLAAGEWCQLIPPAGTACCYIGTVGFDGSGNLIQFLKIGDHYTWATQVVVNMILTSGTYGNTELGAAIPPIAQEMTGVWHISTGANTRLSLYGNVAFGSTGSAQITSDFTKGASATMERYFTLPCIPLTMVGSIRNCAGDSSGNIATSDLAINEWWE